MPAKPKCFIYIDGFNFYYGIFKKHPEWRWLNLERFFMELRPDEEITVKYFTAIIDEDLSNSERRERQLLYLTALSTLPSVRIIKGKFQRKVVRCEAVCGKEYQISREKKTDVNIAIHLVHDCLTKACESIVLVSGDADLESAIAWIHRHDPSLKIKVYIPRLEEERDTRRIDFYSSIGIDWRPLPLERIRTCQFSTSVKIETGRFVTRPDEWTLADPAEG
jgi:hypothetical protein